MNKSTSRRRARSMFGMDAQGSVTDGGNRSWRGSNRVILPDDILAMESRGSHGESSPHLKTPPNTPVLGMVSVRGKIFFKFEFFMRTFCLLDIP